MPQTEYRSVTLRAVPTHNQAKVIDDNLLKVKKFLGIAQTEFQKTIWHKAREDEELSEAHSRLTDLMAQRFAGTVMGQLLYPLDNRNYKFTKENGYFKAEIRFKPKTTVTVNVDRNGNRYHSDILEDTAYPAFLYKYGNDYFMSVSIPKETRWEEGRPVVYIGIDLNQRKHVASLYNPETTNFEENLFFDLKPIDQKCKQLQRNISAIQKGRRNSQLTEEEKHELNKQYKRKRKVIDKGHGDFISKLVEVADRYWENGYNVIFVLEDLRYVSKVARKEYKPFNRWLTSQWCYRRFGVLLEAKPYPVEYIPAKDTSKLCHRCGGEVNINGKRKRMVSCSCGLKDFSRDLNAARNISKILC